MNHPILCFGYVRVSTDRQDLSVDAQTASIQRAVQYQQLPAPTIFGEPDTSGGLPFAERPQGGRLLAAIQSAPPGTETVVIIPKVDRLGRDTVDVSQSAKLLESLGARLIFLDINVDTRTPMGRAFMQIAAVFAELELARIRERIREALNQKRASNLLTGTEPYGFNAIPTGQASPKGVPLRRLEDNPDEQQWILHMRRLRDAGWSYYAIANDLNNRNVPTKRGKGEIMKLSRGRGVPGETRFVSGRWQCGQIAKILASKTTTEWLATRHANQLAA
jgi:putative DNA-invertase from lambdoid prophage Rac